MSTISEEMAAQSSFDRHVDQMLAVVRHPRQPPLALISGEDDDLTPPSAAHPARRGLNRDDPDWRPE
jgi:hypothetical protein